jgi:hypothetical protein
MTLLVLFFGGLSILLIGLSVPLIQVRVVPNVWYGFRIPLTLDHPDIWYPANRYAGKLLLVYGLGLLVVALGLPLLLSGLPEGTATSIYAFSVAVVILVGLVPVVILCWRYAHKLANEYGTRDVN